MQLIQAWKDSLTLLIPKNLKLFALITVNAVVQAYKTVLSAPLTIFLPFIVIFIFYGLFFRLLAACGEYMKISMPASLSQGLFMFLIIVAAIMVHCFWYVAARPSVALKNRRYFNGYFGTCMAIVVWVLGYILLSIILEVKFFETIKPALWVLLYINPIFFWLMTSFFTLFLLDSDNLFSGALYSLWRAFKMTIYNLPVCAIVGLLAQGWVLFDADEALFSLYCPFFERLWIGAAYVFIFLPVITSIMTNIYVKKVHEQFQLYFPEKS